jgi:hypothetical protein
LGVGRNRATFLRSGGRLRCLPPLASAFKLKKFTKVLGMQQHRRKHQTLKRILSDPLSYGTLALHKTHPQSNFTHIYPRTMAFLKQCIRGSPTPPTLIENDDLYPVHTLDDTKTLRRLLLAWTICFNDALDAHKLRCALAKLLDIGDWRKIGGRLALKVILYLYATE